MNLGANKEEADFLLSSIEYFLKSGANKWCDIMYPSADIESIVNQLKIISIAGEE